MKKTDVLGCDFVIGSWKCHGWVCVTSVGVLAVQVVTENLTIQLFVESRTSLPATNGILYMHISQMDFTGTESAIYVCIYGFSKGE